MQRQIPSVESAYRSPLRPLEALDIEIILQGAGPWWLFYAMLLGTGLSCTKVSQLSRWNVAYERCALKASSGRKDRWTFIPLPPNVLRHIPRGSIPDEPLFPSLYMDGIHPAHYEEELNSCLAEPLRFMQSLLTAADRPSASLLSFRLLHQDLKWGNDEPSEWQVGTLLRVVEALETTGGPPLWN